MNYIKPKVTDLNMADLTVENIFINEYMPEADGDFVKVYLLARLYAETDRSISDIDMAKQLGLTQDRILEAWNYWEEWGAIKKHYLGGDGRLDFAVEFVNLKEMLYGGEQEEPLMIETDPEIKVKQVFGNDDINQLMEQIEKKLGRTLSTTDLQSIVNWIEEYKATPEVIMKAVEYCIAKNKMSFRYLGTLIEGWVSQGLNTADKIDEYLELYDQKFSRYKRVMRALGYSKEASEEERRIMDVWFDDLGFNMDKVLEACAKSAGVHNPFLYVNGVLRNWKKDATQDNRDVNEKKPVSNSVLRDYYNFLREKADREAEERRNQIYIEIPKIKEIDDAMRIIGPQLAKAYLSGDAEEGGRLNAELERLNEDRAFYLAEHDYEMDYTDPKYACTECNDTGTAEMGGPCPVCKEQRRMEAEVWQAERETKEI